MERKNLSYNKPYMFFCEKTYIQIHIQTYLYRYMRINIYSNIFIPIHTSSEYVTLLDREAKIVFCIYKDTSCNFKWPCRKFITPGITMHYFTHPLALGYPPKQPKNVTKMLKHHRPVWKKKSDLTFFFLKVPFSFFSALNFSFPIKFFKNHF